MSQYDYAVVYFNFCLYGAPFVSGQYGEALGRVFKRLLETEACVIWRETTPINPGADDTGGQERVRQRNAIAAELAAKHGIPTDSLGSFPADSYRDNVHFNGAAVAAQAEHIAETIQEGMNGD